MRALPSCPTGINRLVLGCDVVSTRAGTLRREWVNPNLNPPRQPLHTGGLAQGGPGSAPRLAMFVAFGLPGSLWSTMIRRLHPPVCSVASFLLCNSIHGVLIFLFRHALRKMLELPAKLMILWEIMRNAEKLWEMFGGNNGDQVQRVNDDAAVGDCI